MKSYDYEHRVGVTKISWERFVEMSRELAERLAAFEIDAVVGIARAGLFPATAVSCALRRELYPVRVTRRFNDQVAHERPVWKVDVSPEVSGKTVAIVDEIADTGETLRIVAERSRALGAARTVTATLVSHSWAAPAPDVTCLVSDELIIFPWDERVFQGGRWTPHPELVAALGLQGRPWDEA